MSNQFSHLKGAKADLTAGNLLGHLLRLSAPMTWGILMVISFQLVDTYFISLLGTQELAAFTFTFPVTYAVFSIFMGFTIAMASVLSRLIGHKKFEEVPYITTHGLLLVALLSLIITGTGFLFAKPLFTLLGAPKDMIPLISEYMEIWLLGAVFLVPPMVGNAAMRATGDAMTPALIMSIAAITNTILDPILIFGLWGGPEMGLKGAALATLIAYIFDFLCAIIILYRKKLISLKALRVFNQFRPTAQKLLFIALPAGLTNLIQPLVNAVIIFLLAKTSTEAVAAFGIVTRIEAFAFVILMGLAVGMSPIIGQCWGAQKFDRVKETLKLSIHFNIIWSLLVAVVLGIFAKEMAGIFSDNPAIIQYTVLFFWIVPFTYAFSNLLNGWSSTFNAIGQPQRSVLIILGRLIILMIPAIYLGYYIAQVGGLFIAIALSNITGGIFFHFWSWKKINGNIS